MISTVSGIYRRILMAYDGSVEGRSALREGALLARQCGAEVFLLAVVNETGSLGAAEGLHAGPVSLVCDRYGEVLEYGLARLRQLGLVPQGQLAVGEPSRVIGDYARKVAADLVIVSHRRQNLLERWWSGSSGSNLLEYLGCSLLISRNVMSDRDFAAEVERYSTAASSDPALFGPGAR